MASEIQFAAPAGITTYVIIHNDIGQVWDALGNSFVTYQSVNYLNYVIAATQEGTASGYYSATFPVLIGPGTYNIIAKQQAAGSPAESDGLLATGGLEWNGVGVASLADTATSGQISQFLPVRLERGVMVENYGIYFKSSTDHITPFTSGIVSGQIARDGGSFTALQSGVFTETGLGWFNLAAFTSGDLLADTAKIVFSAAGISGGNADPVAQFFVLQRTSGQELT